MEVLSSRILLRSADPGRSRHFYRDVLGLAIYREFGSPTDPGVVARWLSRESGGSAAQPGSGRRILAAKRSRRLTTPQIVRPSMTGRWRNPFRSIIWDASSTGVSGLAH